MLTSDCMTDDCRLFRMRRERRHVTVQAPAGARGADNVPQMTALCLSASFCFLVCVTPSMILLIGKPYWNKPHIHWYAIAKSITNQVSATPFCIYMYRLL